MGMKLYIFDIDGTLTEKFGDTLKPEVAEWFRGMRGSDIKVALATNQGGVGLRYWMEQGGFGEPESYPTETKVYERLARISYAIYGLIAVRNRF